MLIQNENDLLGLLIQNAVNDFMNQYDLLQLSGLDHQMYNYYVKSLKSRSLVNTDLANIYLTDLGKNSYVSKQGKAKKSLFDFPNFLSNSLSKHPLVLESRL